MSQYKPVPPRKPPAIQPDDVPNVDRMAAIGITQRKIASHLGLHYRTVHNILCRKGAYAGVPK